MEDMQISWRMKKKIDDEIHIVCVAIRDNTGHIWTLPRPNRHHSVIALMRLSGYNGSVRDQGFLDSNGSFVNRSEAAKIAKSANQILNCKMISSTLTSEDLW